jgi:ATP-dependent RNA helicase DDX54/DBP10
MNLDLRSIQYIVFDEADRFAPKNDGANFRLFEMGFESQLTEILHKLPHSRQTLLFSATLPASLVEFTKAGLQDPILIRLDVEQKVSEDLETAFFSIKPAEKTAGLLYIIQEVIKIPTSVPQPHEPPSKKRKRNTPKRGSIKPYSTLIFVSTKHQVEFVAAVLRKANYGVSYVYGSLDQTARKENVEAFCCGESSVLVVTDVAARGIDIPVLSNVINYDFPAEPKVFVHRVGRTARAGQRGWAYSLVTVDDAPYFIELVDFLGRRLVAPGEKEVNYAKDMALGAIPRLELEKIAEWVGNALGDSSDLTALASVAARGDKLYSKTRGVKSSEMVKRGKCLVQETGWSSVNPLLGTPLPVPSLTIAMEKQDYDDARMKLLSSVSGFRPKETVFEIGHKGTKGKSLAAEIMRARRTKITLKPRSDLVSNANEIDNDGEEASLHTSFRDPENYIDHFKPGNLAQEHGYDVHRPGNSFAEASRSVMMNLIDDGGVAFGPNKPKQRWDSKKKRFINIVSEEGGKGKTIKGESGVKLPASLKSGRFPPRTLEMMVY